jgi:hypothetical protein
MPTCSIENNVLKNVGNHFFWQRKAEESFRYVVDLERLDGGGNHYSIFEVPEAISSDDFLALSYERGEANTGKLNFLFGMSRPPFMLKTKDTGRIWGLFVSAAVPFQEWTVFSHSGRGSVENCKIIFGPAVKKSFVEVLPEDVGKLAGSLDRLLRKGKTGGSSKSPDDVPEEVQWMWANVAMRPWAVQSKPPKNTREHLDWDFLAWLETRKAYAGIYHDIIYQYPKAEKSLASYYAHELGKSPEESENLARSVLEFVCRTYFKYAPQ